MAVEKIEHIGIMVTNMEKSISFYRDIIGLELFDQFEIDHAVNLAFLGFPNANQTVVELIGKENNEFPEEGRVHHIAFTVKGIEEEIERLKGLNISFLTETYNTLPNGTKYIFFYGPDNERVEFFEPGNK